MQSVNNTNVNLITKGAESKFDNKDLKKSSVLFDIYKFITYLKPGGQFRAADCDPEKLKTVFQRAKEVFLYESSRKIFPKEITFKIAYNIILTEYPDMRILTKFAIEALLKVYLSSS